MPLLSYFSSLQEGIQWAFNHSQESSDKYILEVVWSCVSPTFIVVLLYAHA